MWLCLFSFATNAEELAKAYRSIEADYDAVIYIIPQQGRDQYLVDYRGFETSIDGKALLYQKKWKNKHDKNLFFYELMGSRVVSIRDEGKSTIRFASVVPFIEVFSDNTVTKMVFVGNVSVSSIDSVEEKYRSLQGITLSQVKAKSLVAEKLTSLNDSCGSDIEVAVNWKAFSEKGQKTTPSMASVFLESLKNICGKDKDYEDAVKNIQQITVDPIDDTNNRVVSLDQQVLSIRLEENLPNVVETSHRLLMDAL